MKKLLIINPTKEQAASLYNIDVQAVYGRLITKVLGKTKDNFTPMLFVEQHARLLISNIETKIVAISKFAGKQMDTYPEALEYFDNVAQQVYGPDWAIKLLKTEVLTLKEQRMGVNSSSPDAAAKLEFELAGLVDVIFNPAVKGHQAEQTPKVNKTQEEV